MTKGLSLEQVLPQKRGQFYGGEWRSPRSEGVTQEMTIAREEIFGPVLSILKWRDLERMLRDVDSTEYGLACSILTNNLNQAHRTAMRVEAGYVWINHVGQHLLGAPFGGFKQSGMGREERLEELLSFTQQKNIHVRLS